MPTTDPACLIEGDAARWHQAMDMRVGQQFLIPGMQDSQKAEVRSQMLRVGGDGEQRLRDGAEEDVVHDGGILQGKRDEFVRQSKDHVRVSSG